MFSSALIMQTWDVADTELGAGYSLRQICSHSSLSLFPASSQNSIHRVSSLQRQQGTAPVPKKPSARLLTNSWLLYPQTIGVGGIKGLPASQVFVFSTSKTARSPFLGSLDSRASAFQSVSHRTLRSLLIYSGHSIKACLLKTLTCIH